MVAGLWIIHLGRVHHRSQWQYSNNDRQRHPLSGLFQKNLGWPALERLNYSGFQWSKRWVGLYVAVASLAGPLCKSFALRFRQITTPAPHHSFLQAGRSSWRPDNNVKAMKIRRWQLTDGNQIIEWEYVTVLCDYTNQQMAVQPLHRCFGTTVRNQKRKTACPIQADRPGQLVLDKQPHLCTTETDLLTSVDCCLHYMHCDYTTGLRKKQAINNL